MRARSRRASRGREQAIDEGPFVSFTDLFIGILFLFLILVAALMLRQQAAVQAQPIRPPPVKPAALKPEPIPRPRPQQPTFRLGIAFNIYQRSGDGGGWTYSRTVRVFRSAEGHCINTVWIRSNLSTAWKPPTADQDIPTGAQANELGKFEPCGISASGDHWESNSETGDLKRIGADLYSGYAVLHKPDGDEKLEMQYRVVGIYDDYFRAPGSS